MGPLALMARDAGMTVLGSDLAKGAIYDELASAGIKVNLGPQDGTFLEENLEGLDWFVYTSALPEDHPELKKARAAGIKCTKRDDFTEYLIESLNLKLVAVAGTHGKTTTTSMIIWACRELNIPVSYLVGTTLGFAPSGKYDRASEYFIYEADEYDRNFLRYRPWLAAIPVATYDHPDIYPTKEDYQAAFEQFESQSERVIRKGGSLTWKGLTPLRVWPDQFKLAGKSRRADASLAAMVISEMATAAKLAIEPEVIIAAINTFPGVGRRFEKLADGFYTDYAHHPEEIEATIGTARWQSRLDDKKGVVAVYEPHQNARQHEVLEGYKDAFRLAKWVYWVPTYLVRGEKEAAEKGEIKVLRPKDFIKTLSNSDRASATVLDDRLFRMLKKWRDDGYIVLLMTAGPGDAWLREKVKELEK